MSVCGATAFLGAQVAVGRNRPAPSYSYGGVGVGIECSSRPQKKATAHHMKTRPRKTQPWDINRKPTVYAPLPSLPPDWILLSSAETPSSPESPSPAALNAADG